MFSFYFYKNKDKLQLSGSNASRTGSYRYAFIMALTFLKKIEFSKRYSQPCFTLAF